MTYYILNSNHTIKEASLMEWAEWYGESVRRVGLDETQFFSISTVFLGLDHRLFGEGPPIVFETMVFEKESKIHEFFGKLYKFREEMDVVRYSSWDDAFTGHQTMLRKIQRQEEIAKELSPKEPSA